MFRPAECARMQEAVGAVLEFIEGPVVMAKRGMPIEDVVDCLKENQASGTLVDLGVAPNAILRKAIEHPGVDLSGVPFTAAGKWLSVRTAARCARIGRFCGAYPEHTTVHSSRL